MNTQQMQNGYMRFNQTFQKNLKDVEYMFEEDKQKAKTNPLNNENFNLSEIPKEEGIHNMISMLP